MQHSDVHFTGDVIRAIVSKTMVVVECETNRDRRAGALTLARALLVQYGISPQEMPRLLGGGNEQRD